MASIRHRFGVHQSVEQVFKMVATTEGLASWWTKDVRGHSSPGEALEFYFGQPAPAAVMIVENISPMERVVWSCAQGPDLWVGTQVDFEVQEAEEEVILKFTHGAWSEPADFMYHCSMKWAYHLIGLRDLLGGGSASPWPEDEPVSSWG